MANQKEFFSEYAARNGYELVRLYADEGISGTSLKKREAFHALLRDAGMGHFDMVVVKDVSRFARNTVDFLQSIRTLKALGVNTLFLTANMETLGGSEFVLTLFGALAQEESVNLSKRVKFGKKLNAQKGRVPLRVFGYRRIDNFTLEIDPTEAEAVREIYRLYLQEGLGLRKISQRLNEAGIPTKLGCRWEAKGVRRILTNPLYSGHYVNHKYEIGDVLEGKQVPLPAEEHFHHLRPDWAIVSEADFAAVQAAVARRSRKSGPAVDSSHLRHSSRYAFSGLIRCEECGYAFRRRQYRGNPPYWLCSSNDHSTAAPCDNTVRLLEEDLLHALRQHLEPLSEGREALVSEVMSTWNLRRDGDRHLREERRRDDEVRRLNRKLERYGELYAEGFITLSAYREKQAQLSGRLELLSAAQKRAQIPFLTEEECFSAAEKLLRLEELSYQEAHSILSRITVSGSGLVTLELRPAPSLPN